jgi:hypothetical protein
MADRLDRTLEALESVPPTVEWDAVEQRVESAPLVAGDDGSMGVRRHRLLMVAASVIFVGLLVVVLVAVTRPAEDDPELGTEPPAPAPTNGEATPTEATIAPPSALRLESAVVMAGPSGVQVVSVDGSSTSVAADPAAVAFAIGTDLIVFQDAEPSGGAAVFPPWAAGPVKAWIGGEVRTLPAHPDARRVLLLDAALIDGAPFALVAEFFGEVDPEDTFEELVQIDLRDDTRTTIVRRSAWEAGHFAARLLPGGDVIGLFWSDAPRVSLARWSTASEDALWEVEIGVDFHVDLALRDGEVTLTRAFGRASDLALMMTISTHDGITGDEQSSASIEIEEPYGEIDSGLFCRDWASATAVVCGQPTGTPIVVSALDGSFARLPGEPGSIPTVVRPR